MLRLIEVLSPNTTVHAQRCVVGAGAPGCAVDIAAKGLGRSGSVRVRLRFAGGGMVGEAVVKMLNIEMRMAR